MQNIFRDSFPGTVLFVSPISQDQAALRRILPPPHSAIGVATCRQALEHLDRSPAAVVLCDSDLPDGSWLDLFHSLASADDPPLLIVTSRLADDRLWAEVLNLGGFDVIAKPFDKREVLHVLETARIHKQRLARTREFGGSQQPAAAAG